MTKEYIHHEGSRERLSLSGEPRSTELVLDYNGSEIVAIVKKYGENNELVVVPGKIAQRNYGTSADGRSISQISLITSTEAQRDITDLLKKIGHQGQVNFWKGL